LVGLGSVCFPVDVCLVRWDFNLLICVVWFVSLFCSFCVRVFSVCMRSVVCVCLVWVIVSVAVVVLVFFCKIVSDL